jgi:HAD superfamily hydrolase (TIGR01509 family)
MKNSILENMKCAIFDMDGTILDSMPMWHTIANRYLESLGKVPREDLWDNVKQLNMVETAQYFIDEYGVQKSIEEIGVEVEKLIMKYYGTSLELKKGAREFLEKLNELGIPCVLATATERSCVLACMKRLDCEKYFKEILTCLDLNTSKSSPLIFEESARRCNAKPQESVVFEDALHAIRTAHKAGFKVCAVYDASDEERTEPPLTDWERILQIADMDCKFLTELL